MSQKKDNAHQAKEQNNNSDINMKKKDSSLSEFVSRSVANKEHIENFEQYVADGIKDNEIEESLAEIYKNESGNDVDITKLEKKKGFTVLGVFFFLLFILLFLIGATWSYYIFLYPQKEQSADLVDMTISGPQKIISGEDFIYKIDYTNPTEVEIKNVEIKIVYPDNFIFVDSYPPIMNNDKTAWDIKNIGPLSKGGIKIKGKIIGKEKDKNIILANMSWTPINSTAGFRKERALETIISNASLNFDFVTPPSVLVGDVSNISVKYKSENDNFLKNFRLKIDQLENIEFISGSVDENNTDIDDDIKVGILKINEIDKDEHEIDIKFKVVKKINETEKMVLHFEYLDDNGAYYSFFDQTLDFNVIKNDLNLSLILNGSSNSQGVNFGQTLNYSLAFSNDGNNDLGDIAIMGIVDSDILDWSSINVSHDGIIKNNTISWSHREAPLLKTLQKGDDGMVNFSINILPFDKIGDKDIDYKISSYAQFGIGVQASTTEELTIDETRSNTIIAKVNSNLELNEKVRYFNEDNIAVGLGPLPPRVGESTSYRVYWEITNSLHKLENLIVKTKLPKYVYWVSNMSPTIGKINYKNTTHEVTWDIGDLKISELIGSVEFDISVSPIVGDEGKVLALLSGTVVKAQDVNTDSKINLINKASTTRLEDDEIGISDGIVRANED